MSKFIEVKHPGMSSVILNASTIDYVYPIGETQIYFKFNRTDVIEWHESIIESYKNKEERDARYNELKALLTAPERLQIFGEGHRCPQCQTIFTTSEFTKV